jgi:hypothetical protein
MRWEVFEQERDLSSSRFGKGMLVVLSYSRSARLCTRDGLPANERKPETSSFSRQKPISAGLPTPAPLRLTSATADHIFRCDLLQGHWRSMR